jgi:hypothetical protein
VNRAIMDEAQRSAILSENLSSVFGLQSYP